LSDTDVYDYLRGSLTGAAAKRIAQHLVQCADCREFIACVRDDGSDQGTATTEPASRPPITAGAEARALAKALGNGRDLSGQTIAGKYRLDRRLGAGGMGVVYEALNTWTGRRVAVKLLHPSFSTDEEVVSRFRREARSATRITHPNIVDVLDLGQDPNDGTLYMVQEFLTGDTLRQRISAKTRFSMAEAVEILVPIMNALAAAHDAGVVHRDVKPENIILSIDHHGRPVPTLIDFGISKQADDVAVLLQTGRALGTPLYMSPEQLRADDSIDGRTDLWALGVVWFELLAGRRPFDAKSYSEVAVQILTTDAPPIRSLVATVPDDVAAVIARALMRDRDARFPTVRDMLDALVACPVVAPVPSAVADPAARSAPAPGRRWPLYVAAGLCAAAAAVAAGVLTHQTRSVPAQMVSAQPSPASSTPDKQESAPAPSLPVRTAATKPKVAGARADSKEQRPTRRLHGAVRGTLSPRPAAPPTEPARATKEKWAPMLDL
jgi:serine/threonine-protein kinase